MGRGTQEEVEKEGTGEREEVEEEETVEREKVEEEETGGMGWGHGREGRDLKSM